MEKSLLLAAAALPLAAHGAAGATGAASRTEDAPTRRPNIILFMVDDMGWQDTSVPFWSERTPYNRLFETPAMERLASMGTLFTQAYASSISSPSRCSLLTGCNAARHCVTNWTLERDKSTDHESPTLQRPEWNVNGILQSGEVDRTFRATSFVELLRRSGYHTIHCGKAHFGAIDTPGEDPHHFGFEVNIAGHAAGGPASYLGEQNYGNRTDGAPQSLFATPGLEKYWGTETFLSEALTREALHALDKARRYGQPFFLYMAHYAVHVPVDRDARFFAKYKERGLSDREAAYAALVEGMDKSLGDLLDWLERNDELQNTIILFMSDNGGLAAEGTRDGALHTQNAPLNSGKGSAYEGGIREPMLVYWPGVTRGGERCDDYLLIEDFYPTILEMAGIRRYRTVQPIDGRSFVPLLTGRGPNPARGRSLYWNCPNVWGPTGPGIGPTCTIRRGDWKLVYYYEDGRRELFNIRRDIGEREELSASEPRRVRELSRRLGRFLRRVGAQRPSFKATGEPCPWPDEVGTKAPGDR